MAELTLSQFLKSKGVRSVKALSEHSGRADSTLYRWYNEGDWQFKVLLMPAIERYLEDKKG